MKKITKILSVFMAAVMLMTALCVPASAASVKSPKLTKTSISISVGDKYQLYVNYAIDSISWSSSDTKIATVKKGKITAKKAGTAIITAKHGDTKLECKVKVKKASSVDIPSKSENSTVTVYNNHTYAIFDSSCTWDEAKKYCEKMGGHLVTISSKNEQSFINKLIKKNKDNKNCYWIGLYKKSKDWKWVDGKKYSYSNWAPNEPNSYDGEEAYVHVFGTVFTGGNGRKEIGDWNDASIDGAGYAAEFYAEKNFGYICEWDITE